MKIFKVTTPTNLRDFTDNTYPQGSFIFERLLKNKDIKVNGIRVNKNVLLYTGDEIVYYTDSVQEGKKSHETVFEDDNVLIVDKYSGVTVEGLFFELSQKGNYILAHRLDRNTQGLLIFAKTNRVADLIYEGFSKKQIKKTYLAICKNAFKRDYGYLIAYLQKDAKKSQVKIFDKQIKGAQEIITEYTIVERMGDVALISIALHTGRTHQIRAHMAHIGCPVLGDNKYGDEELNKKYKLKRQCLVAKELKFALKSELSYLNNYSFKSRFAPDIYRS